VAEDIVGPDGPNSEGFTAYELNEKCASSGKGGRSYSLATTHQDFRDMEAPFKGRKTYGRPLDKHDQVTKDLLEVGVADTYMSDSNSVCFWKALATCSMRCFNKAPQSLKTPIQRRSAMLNLPRIGADENYAFPAFHLNISSTKEPTSGEQSTSATGSSLLTRCSARQSQQPDWIGWRSSLRHQGHAWRYFLRNQLVSRQSRRHRSHVPYPRARSGLYAQVPRFGMLLRSWRTPRQRTCFQDPRGPHETACTDHGHWLSPRSPLRRHRVFSPRHDPE
jgi:hypothetical protein